jgi:hypothetical protein
MSGARSPELAVTGTFAADPRTQISQGRGGIETQMGPRTGEHNRTLGGAEHARRAALQRAHRVGTGAARRRAHRAAARRPAGAAAGLEDELKAIVASATGREVLTLLSATPRDRDLSAEVLLLSGEAPTTQQPPRSSAVDQVQAHARDSRSEAQAVRAEPRQARVKHKALRKYIHATRWRRRSLAESRARALVPDIAPDGSAESSPRPSDHQQPARGGPGMNHDDRPRSPSINRSPRSPRRCLLSASNKAW